MGVDIELTMGPDTETEYEYVLSHGKELRKYAGRWIAILGENVVCSGKELHKVMNSVEKSHPGKIPFVIKISEKGRIWV